MKIVISSDALEWFDSEMDVTAGDHIRFFPRYGGTSQIHQGFSLGVNREEPVSVGVETTIADVQYYIEERDVWFFNNHDLYVEVNKLNGELMYRYVQW